MKRPVPSRRFLKWTGLVVSVLVAMTWIINLVWSIYYDSIGSDGVVHVTGLVSGCVGVERVDLLTLNNGAPVWNTPGWHMYRRIEPIRWGGMWHFDSARSFHAWVPLWMPFGLLAAPTAWLWWRDSRVAPGYCRTCRYNLTGLAPHAACPECGRAQP